MLSRQENTHFLELKKTLYPTFNICREKKVLASSQDYGKDLPGVQNLRKKMQRLSGELNTHKPVVEQLLDSGKAFQRDNAGEEEAVEGKCTHLSDAWQELLVLAEDR